MGYFSNLIADRAFSWPDHSLTSPQQQLFWRLEELKDRYQELRTGETGKWDEGACFSENDLRYVLPEHFGSASDVRKAIALVIRDLHSKYGIRIREENPREAGTVDEITGMQLCFFGAEKNCLSHKTAPPIFKKDSTPKGAVLLWCVCA